MFETRMFSPSNLFIRPLSFMQAAITYSLSFSSHKLIEPRELPRALTIQNR